MVRLFAFAAIAGLLELGRAGSPSLAASPADKAFTVANYPVEAEDTNAVAAKDKALADGQEAAFRSLLKRIVPVTAYHQLTRVKAAKSADFIDGVKVRSERNSATRYIASLDFAFQADSVRDLLQREGVPFVEEQAPVIVVLPVLSEAKGGMSTFVPASGTWLEVWKGLDLDNTVSPARLETPKPGLHPDTIRMMLGGTGEAGRILYSEYKTENVVVAIADIDTPGQRLNVTLAGHDAVGPFSWQRSYRVYDRDVDYAMELASVVSLGVIEGRWKAAKTGTTVAGGSSFAGAGEDIAINVQFGSTGEWHDIRARLLDTPGADDIRVGAVFASSAEVSLRYPGGGASLAEALASHGLVLVNDGPSWLLRSAY